MSNEMLPTSPPNAENGIEKRREVAETIRNLFESNFEAAHELIEKQGGVTIRDEQVVPLEKGREGSDHWYLATKLFHESLEQKRLAAEEQGDIESARQFALAQDFSKSHHDSVATYLDARNSYPELMEIIEDIYPNFPEKLKQAQEAYGNN